MKKNKILTSVLAILLVLVSAVALVACTDKPEEQGGQATNETVKTAIEMDNKIGVLASLVAKDLEPIYANGEIINTLIRAGYQFEEGYIDSYKTNVQENYEQVYKNVKALSSAVGAYIAFGEKVPYQLVTMINQYRPVGYGTFTYRPLVVELIEMGMHDYPVSVREAFEQTLIKQCNAKPEFGTGYIDDQASEYIMMFADKYNSNEYAKSIVDASLAYMKSVLKGDNAGGNIVSTADILIACVEMDYCGIEHGIDEQSVYEWLSSKILDDGSFDGYGFEPIETLKAMVSYQRFHKIDGSTITRVK